MLIATLKNNKQGKIKYILFNSKYHLNYVIDILKYNILYYFFLLSSQSYVSTQTTDSIQYVSVQTNQFSVTTKRIITNGWLLTSFQGWSSFVPILSY